jgi:hypothetical protein
MYYLTFPDNTSKAYKTLAGAVRASSRFSVSTSIREGSSFSSSVLVDLASPFDDVVASAVAVDAVDAVVVGTVEPSIAEPATAEPVAVKPFVDLVSEIFPYPKKRGGARTPKDGKKNGRPASGRVTSVVRIDDRLRGYVLRLDALFRSLDDGVDLLLRLESSLTDVD